MTPNVRWTISASRSRRDETIHVELASVKPLGDGHFYLSRDEAYDLAEALIAESDWLGNLEPSLFEENS